MLKYQLGKQVFGNDTVSITYKDAVLIDDYIDQNSNANIVTVSCDNVDDINSGDILTVVSNFLYYNDEMGELGTVNDTSIVQVYSVDRLGCTISFLDSKYKNLTVDSIAAEVVKEGNETTITWIFSFNPIHYFNGSPEDIPDIYINYGAGSFLHLTGAEGLTYDNIHQLSWVYNEVVPNAKEVSDLLFGDIDTSKDDIIEGNIGKVVVTRNQVKWNSYYNQDNPTLYIDKYQVKLNVPISLKSSVDLHHEGNLKEYFVDYEERKAINSPIEMEKQVYNPVVVKDGDVYEDCVKINFNLHFRNHSGKDWTVKNTDSWVFDVYGDNDNWNGNKYYSYAQTGETNENKWRRSCQSDLLGYLDFVTNDVKYQKNKLKKSFLRLSYYDSMNAAEQRLLAYSTIFMDNNKLYSKFISRSNFECYFDDNDDIVKGIKVDREVNTGARNMNGSLMNILNVSSVTTEEIEDYRLSSQISVKNKYNSTASSEGFYLYTWESDGDVTIPMDIYMKAEFNHAGYGRTIPMMAPYKDVTPGFKTNYDIIDDWNNGGYGIKKYQRYSYIHLKAEYDNTMKRYIYYLDPTTYGNTPKIDGNIININLYEARINFD
jgi:hypothetical protein